LGKPEGFANHWKGVKGEIQIQIQMPAAAGKRNLLA